MKESQFNLYFTAPDGTKLAFNSLSCGLAIVDDDYNNLLKNISDLNDNNVPENLKEVYLSAKEGNFIVENEQDEILDLITKRNCQKYNTETLGLTIAPTLACNFKCIYCFENSKNGVMTNEVANKIIDFVQNRSSSIHHLDVAWYGGEPLLATESIYYLSENFIKICKNNDISYHAYMITNGSLITDKIIENMIKYNIRGAQITIDGPPEIHDKRRISKSGDSTFYSLITNINKLLKIDNFELTLRINVDKTNEAFLDSLLKILHENLISHKIKITFGHVSAYTEACKSIENNCFSNKEFALNMVEYYKLLKKYGFAEYNDFPYPTVKLNYCCAEVVNALVIDHEGYVYKCWNQVGDIDMSIGNIVSEDFDPVNYKHGYWLERNPVNNAKCKSCNLLPVCMGGCPYSSLILGKNDNCDSIKFNIKKIMLSYYNNFIEHNI